MDQFNKKPSHREKTTNLVINNSNEINFAHHEDSSLDSGSTKVDSIINKKKWKCSQCTYENWPSALKCTICLAGKSSTASVNNQINSKLKAAGNNNNNNRSNQLNNKSFKSLSQVTKKRNDSNNRNSKYNESKVKLKFETSNSNNKVLDTRSEENYLNCSSSSSDDNLNDRAYSKTGLNKTVKGKKKEFTNDIYKIGDLIIKNCK